jgi:hypothetical protein
VLLVLLALPGCQEGAGLFDFDDDGSLDADDCKPSDASIHPGADDVYGDGIDNNCDGIDGIDLDGDGYASTESGGDDCNDSDSSVHPGATEVADTIDQDCDGFAIDPSVDLRPDNPLTSDELYLQISSDASALVHTWFVDGIELTGDSNLEQIPNSETSKGEVWRVESVPYNAEGVAGDPVVDSVVIGNSPPNPANLTQSLQTDPREGDILTAVAVASDDDLDDVTFLYTWYINEVVVIPSTPDALDSTWFDKGDSIYAVLTPTDGTDTGTSVLTNVVVAINTPPSALAATLDPSAGTEETTFGCSVGGWTDPDPGDVEGYEIQWYVDLLASVTGPTLDGAAFDKGQTVRCEATPTDGEDAGATFASETVEVANTPPSISAVAIDPTSGTETTTFTCLPSGWVDPDPADVEGYLIHWYVGPSGAEVSSVTTTTIDGTFFDQGDSLYCEATPTDGEESGGMLTSSAVTVDNTVPSVSSVSIDPAAAHTDTLLTAVPNGWSDPDPADPEDYLYEWFAGSTPVGTNTASLDGSYFVKGDEITVTITPQDSTSAGNPVSASTVTILNSPPTTPVVDIAPAEPTEEDDLLCSLSAAATDLDGDTLLYDFEWLDPSGVSAYTLGAVGPGATLSVLSSATANSETWTCEVTATDDDAAPLTSPAGSGTVTVVSGDCTSVSWSLGQSVSQDIFASYPSEWTIEGWFKPGGNYTGSWGGGIVGLPAVEICGGNTEWHLVVGASGMVNVHGPWNENGPYTGSWTTDQWLHFALQRESGGSTGSLWIDGELAQTFSGVPAPSPQCNLYIGNRQGSSTNNADGALASLRFSDGARYIGAFTPSYQFGVDTDTIWSFDFAEGAGSTTNDETGTNSLSIGSFAWETDGPGCFP